MQDLNPHQDASQALRQLEAATDRLALPLLRQLEAYLGLLRQQVPRQTLQAVFVLVSQDCPKHYSRLGLDERQGLQRRLQTLTAEACCLLTVEHLVLLARKLQADHQQIKQERRRKILAALERLNGEEQDEPSGEGLILSVQEPLEDDTTLPLGPPRDPQGLERWCLWLRQAMVLHLRTLSHQLNVELLNHHLIQAVLPVRLLDAVLAGDVEAMQAPENLLKIAVPMGNEENAPQVVTCVVLLRLQDMEFAHRPLRQSRERLQKHQKVLQSLVAQSRQWRKRLVTEQAMADWNNDLQQIQPPRPCVP
ncbi:hypothetical protein [Candidatus Synechococcus spongiarum]|uniref:Sll1884 protein n=1 Tax=Candidatus Synechococcus spongiarum TaxID=431041 RepID=A0A164ZRH6_9SYNE|nr:hypothetical protein [Candidatus Synechococcus spongiarum]SAY38963.1 Sll1884 protein [Candidatus Synechococcus spongiarum]